MCEVGLDNPAHSPNTGALIDCQNRVFGYIARYIDGE